MLFLNRNYFLKSKTIISYMNQHYNFINQTKRYLCILQVPNYYFVNFDNNKTYSHILLNYNKNQFNKKHILNVQSKWNLLYLPIYSRKFSINASVGNPDTFGNLSYNKYEKIEMDMAEEKEEEFIEKVKVPRKERYTYKDYCVLIKAYLNKKNLKMALSILDLMKENGDKPNIYIYKLLLSGFSKQGDIKQCFKLFRKIKQRGLIPTASVYTTLINVCAETDDTSLALEYLAWLKNYFYTNRIDLNNIHYAALIKAYGYHKQIATAFQIADETKDKNISSSDIIAALFHGIIEDTENGLKYALILWHKMKVANIKPNIYHYNLLLKAINDTKLGDLKINDILIPGLMNTQIQLQKYGQSDLLDSPPTITTSLISLVENNKCLNSNDSLVDVAVLLNTNLNNILKKYRLLLFGGINKFLQYMKNDNVKPNMKTLTLMLNLLPPTKNAEEYLIRYIDNNKLSVDITFFNVLIKRRNTRKEFEAATKLLDTIQRYHLSPNIVTFGVLAIGCIKYSDGKTLLEQMNNIGYVPNEIIMNTLFYKACYSRNFDYVIYLMEYALENKIGIPKYILDVVEKFDTVALDTIEKQDRLGYKNIHNVRNKYNNFKIKYENWRENVQNMNCFVEKRHI